jgi:uncharacterized hydrophobic protein (TIGR00271 family)
MGVDEHRKAEVYLEISQAATLRDASYWLQVVFAAGIATLGLILNSPAVIIGAMLISPLIGPILSLGLSLATGDFVLLARAIALYLFTKWQIGQDRLRLSFLSGLSNELTAIKLPQDGRALLRLNVNN